MSMSTSHSAATAVRSREELVAFIQSLRIELEESPGRWANKDLPGFLEALAAWVDDMPGYYENRGEPIPDSPSWAVVACMLAAARVYE